MLAALRIVRIERAVRPCFPITLPTSLCATRNRITVASPSATASTETLSGSSTSARAISVTSSVMFVTGFSPVGSCVASVITHTFGFGSSRRNAHASPFVSSLARSSGKCWNERNTGRRQSGNKPTLLLCIFKRLTMQYQGVYVKRCAGRTTRNLTRHLSLGTKLAFPKLAVTK